MSLVVDASAAVALHFADEREPFADMEDRLADGEEAFVARRLVTGRQVFIAKRWPEGSRVASAHGNRLAQDRLVASATLECQARRRIMPGLFGSAVAT